MADVAATNSEAGPSTSLPTGQLTPLPELLKLSAKRTRAVFLTENGEDDLGGLERAYIYFILSWVASELIYGHPNRSTKLKTASRLAKEFNDVQVLPPVLAAKHGATVGPKKPTGAVNGATNGAGGITNGVSSMKLIGGPGDASTNG